MNHTIYIEHDDSTISDDPISLDDEDESGCEEILKLILDVISRYHSNDHDSEANDTDKENDEYDGKTDDAVPDGNGNTYVRKQALLKSDYRSNNDYVTEVTKSVQRILNKHGDYVEPRRMSRNGTWAFVFNKSIDDFHMECHVYIEGDICNCRIEFQFCGSNDIRPERLPVIDNFFAEHNHLRYGRFVRNSEGLFLKHSFCFLECFSEAAFERYYDALNHTLNAFTKELTPLLVDKELPNEQRNVVQRMISDLSVCLL